MSEFAKEKIGVAIRVRPLSEREQGGADERHWAAEDGCRIRKIGDPEAYDFDTVLGEGVDNEAVYNDVVAPLVKAALDGYNATCFAYGQTGSGKTFTIHGSETNPGVLAYAVRDIFQYIDECPNREFLLGVSFLELYNEQLLDLLTGSNDSQLKIRENEKGEVTVAGLGENLVKSEEDIAERIAAGENRRHVGETNMNSRSSRSHVIFRLSIVSKAHNAASDSSGTVSWLNFVDLAGSEKSDQAGTSGARLTEGCAINKSLGYLVNVIQQLSTGASYVSFRDSKLTRMLQNSLGGNARVCLIATVSPVDISTTKSTLQFAQRATKVKTKAVINSMKESVDNLRNRYENQIKELQSQLQNRIMVEQGKNDMGEQEKVMEDMRKEQELLRKQLENMREFVLMSSIKLPTDEAEVSDVARLKKAAKSRRHTLCPGALAGRPNFISCPSPTLTVGARNYASLEPSGSRDSISPIPPPIFLNDIESSFAALSPENLKAEWDAAEALNNEEPPEFSVTPSPQPSPMEPPQLPSQEAQLAAMGLEASAMEESLFLSEEGDDVVSLNFADPVKKRLHSVEGPGSMGSPGTVAVPKKKKSSRRSVVVFSSALETVAERAESDISPRPILCTPEAPKPKPTLLSMETGALKARITELEETLASERLGREDLLQRLEMLDQSHDELKSFVVHEKEAYALTPKTPASAKARSAQLFSELQQLTDDLGEAKDQLATQETQLQERAKSLAEQSDKIAKLEKESEFAKRNADDYAFMMEEEKKKAKNKERALMEVQKQLEEIAEVKAMLESQLSTKDGVIAALESEAKMAEELAMKLGDVEAMAEEHKATFVDELNSQLQVAKEASESIIKEKEERIAQLESELSNEKMAEEKTLEAAAEAVRMAEEKSSELAKSLAQREDELQLATENSSSASALESELASRTAEVSTLQSDKAELEIQLASLQASAGADLTALKEEVDKQLEEAIKATDDAKTALSEEKTRAAEAVAKLSTELGQQQQATEEVEKQLEEAIKATDDAKTALSEEKTRAAEAVAKLSTELGQQQQATEEVEKQLEEAIKATDDAKTALSEEKTRAAEAVAKLSTELGQQQQATEEVSKQLEEAIEATNDAKAALAEEQTRSAAQVAEANHNSADAVANLTIELGQQQKAKEEVEKHLEDALIATSNAKAALSEEQTRSAALDAQLAETNNQHSEVARQLQIANEASDSNMKEKDERIVQLESELGARKAEVSTLQSGMAALEVQLASLQASVGGDLTAMKRDFGVQLEEAHKAADDAKSALLEEKTRTAVLEAQIAETNHNSTEAEAKLTAKLGQQEKEMEEVGKRLEEAIVSTNNAKAAHSEEQTRVAARDTQLAEANHQHCEIARQLQIANDASDSRIKEKDERIAQLELELSTVKEKEEKALTDAEDLVRTNNEAVRMAEEKASGLSKSGAALAAQVSALQSDKADLEAQLASLHASVGGDLAALKEEVRKQLEDALKATDDAKTALSEEKTRAAEAVAKLTTELGQQQKGTDEVEKQLEEALKVTKDAKAALLEEKTHADAQVAETNRHNAEAIAKLTAELGQQQKATDAAEKRSAGALKRVKTLMSAQREQDTVESELREQIEQLSKAQSTEAADAEVARLSALLESQGKDLAASKANGVRLGMEVARWTETEAVLTAKLAESEATHNTILATRNEKIHFLSGRVRELEAAASRESEFTGRLPPPRTARATRAASPQPPPLGMVDTFNAEHKDQKIYALEKELKALKLQLHTKDKDSAKVKGTGGGSTDASSEFVVAKESIPDHETQPLSPLNATTPSKKNKSFRDRLHIGSSSKKAAKAERRREEAENSLQRTPSFTTKAKRTNATRSEETEADPGNQSGCNQS